MSTTLVSEQVKDKILKSFAKVDEIDFDSFADAINQYDERLQEHDMYFGRSQWEALIDWDKNLVMPPKFQLEFQTEDSPVAFVLFVKIEGTDHQYKTKFTWIERSPF